MTIKPKLRGGGRYYKIKKISAFTLVELIIVITILAILTTIAFLNFGNYTSEARDMVRKTDFETIKKALELYKIENGEYPEPENIGKEKTINKDGLNGLIEGEIGENLQGKLKLGSLPKDPQTKEKYPYMVSEDRETYLLRLELESGEILSVGDIAGSCKNLKEKGQFKGNGFYPIYHNELEPREVYCREDEDRDFYDFVLGGSMEPLYGDNPNSIEKYAFNLGGSQISNEKNSTPGGNYSIKSDGQKTIQGLNYTYIKSENSRIKISGKIFLEANGGNPARVLLGFYPYDKDFKYITPYNIRPVIGSETYLTKDLKSSDKVANFYCNDEIEEAWKNGKFYHDGFKNTKLDWNTAIAYNVDTNGKYENIFNDNSKDYEDLPNFNVTTSIGRYGHKSTRIFRLERIGDECKLYSYNSFGKNISKNTSIRRHLAGEGRVFAELTGCLDKKPVQNCNISLGKWSEVSGIIENIGGTHGTGAGKIPLGTRFLKPVIIVGHWNRWNADNTKTLGGNPEAITYIDDINIEVID